VYRAPPLPSPLLLRHLSLAQHSVVLRVVWV
jgi:hypothetical protein